MPWALVVALALPGSVALAIPEVPPETTASVSLGHVGEDIDPQIRNELEAIDLLIRGGRYPEAETAAREALTELEASGSGGSIEAAWYTDRLVETLLRSDKVERLETLSRANASLRIKRSLPTVDSIEVIRSQIRLGRVLTKRNAYVDARLALDDAQSILEDSPSVDAQDIAAALQAIGTLECAQGHEDQAQPFLERALAILEASSGPNSLEVATVLRTIGECASDPRDIDKSVQLLQRARDICLETLGDQHPELAITLTPLGWAFRQTGNWAQSRQLLEQAVLILETTQGADSPLTSNPLVNLGQVLNEMGEFQLARGHLERAVAIRLREYGDRSPRVAAALNNLGNINVSIGDLPAAEEQYREAADIWESSLGPLHPLVAKSLLNLGIVLAETARPKEALAPMEKSLEILIHNHGRANVAVAEQMSNLGQLSSLLGDYEAQRRYCADALEIITKLGNENFRRYAVPYQCLATAYRGLKEMDNAIRFAEQSVLVTEEALGSSHPWLAMMLELQARILVESGQIETGLATAVRCENTSREHLQLMLDFSTENEALNYAAWRASSINLLVTFAGITKDHAREAASAAWDGVVRLRAMILDEIANRRVAAVDNEGPETNPALAELRDASEQLSKLIVGGPGDSDVDSFLARVSSARARKARAERNLGAKSSAFQERLRLSSAGLSEVRQSLPASSSLIAFFKHGRQDLSLATNGPLEDPFTSTPFYSAFILPPGGGEPKVVPLAEAEFIDGLVARYQESMHRERLSPRRESFLEEAHFRQAAEELRRTVWDPVAPFARGAENILIVPDGALSMVNFGTLPDGGTQYLIETMPPIHYLSSERDLLREKRVHREGDLFALGAPDFDSRGRPADLSAENSQMASLQTGGSRELYRGPRSTCGSFQSMSFDPLPEAAREVEEIQKLWLQGGQAESGATVLTGSAASETAFKQSASGSRVLHLATHGFFLGGDCGSALDLETSGATRENPLLLSGLVLAGANHRAATAADEDDGILTAEEIATLDLGDTEWAVLSACDTGRGEIRYGEGVLGLQRAFRVAGVQTLIMSLWPVEDDSARRWMTSLYRHHFAEGESTMDSTHNASLELLQERRALGLSTHPYYWAGFIASGDWR